MVELRSLKIDAQAPEGDAWVLIEKRDDLFFITGRQNGVSVDASVTPTPLSTAEAAMRAATTWADLLSVALIYMRDER